MMRLVIIESPFAGRHGAKCSCADCLADVERNRRYRDAAMRDSLLRGESPLASTKLYADGAVLNDAIPLEREIGIEAGLAWCSVSEGTVVYTDLGISSGMHRGIERAQVAGREVVFRSLPEWRQA